MTYVCKYDCPIKDVKKTEQLQDTHLYCLVVQAGIYSDAVECFALDVRGPWLNPRTGERCLAFFHLLHLLVPSLKIIDTGQTCIQNPLKY